MKDVSGITPAALDKLCSGTWQGNIRELRNCVERMVVLASGKMLDIADVPELVSTVPSIVKKEPVNSLNLECSEKELIRKALAECGNNRAALDHIFERFDAAKQGIDVGIQFRRAKFDRRHFHFYATVGA